MERQKFLQALHQRFDIVVQERAHWFLQASIQQDMRGNILLYQSRYALMVMRRYLPSAPTNPAPKDDRRYKQALPHGFRRTRDDNSEADNAVRVLETRFGI